MSDRLTRSTLRNLILETLQEASPWAHPAPGRKPVVLAWGFDKRLSDKTTPEAERIKLLGQIVYKELEKIIDRFSADFGSLEDDDFDDDIAGYIDDEESIGLWKSDRGREKGEATYKAYEQAMEAVWDSARATAKMWGFDWDAVNDAISRARDGAAFDSMADRGYTLPPERYTQDQADDLKRSWGIDVPAGTVKSEATRILRATLLSEAMSAAERGRGLYITTGTVDKIKQTFNQSMTAGYYEVLEHALEDGAVEEDAEDMAMATLQDVVDEAMKEFREAMGHFDASSFTEAVERDAYDDDDDLTDERPIITDEQRQSFMSLFKKLESMSKDPYSGIYDEDIDVVMDMLGHLDIYL